MGRWGGVVCALRGGAVSNHAGVGEGHANSGQDSQVRGRVRISASAGHHRGHPGADSRRGRGKCGPGAPQPGADRRGGGAFRRRHCGSSQCLGGGQSEWAYQ